ncbi:MAG: KGG domain-containing protein [Halobacteriales archaeon]|nr:KGG domain-containing protein [Halobacteriales archaeon]
MDDTSNTDTTQPARSRRGFAAMDPEKQREIARKGGRASGGRPENLRGVDRRAAGRKGGHAVVDKYGPQHMAEIGRKGGRSSGGFARMDPERQREIAAKGGRAGGQGHAEVAQHGREEFGLSPLARREHASGAEADASESDADRDDAAAAPGAG